MIRYFCTYFDSNYLVRGLAMCRSLMCHSSQAVIFVLALDDYCYDFLVSLGNDAIIPIRLEDLELFDQELTGCKVNRTRAEYIFTMTPCLPRYLLVKHPAIDLLTYLDADLLFFSSPEPIYAELGDGNVAIMPHRFSNIVQYMAKERGVYNVSWISFANNAEGQKCLEWYRLRCLAWCYDRVEDDRFADQKYLEKFREVALGVVPIDNQGANLAPWNLGNGGLELRGGEIEVDGDRLIFFHYQGLTKCLGSFYDCGLFAFRLHLAAPLRKAIFCRYIHATQMIKSEYCLELPIFGYGMRYKSQFPLLAWLGKKSIELAKIVLGFCVYCPKSPVVKSQN